jgi:hypothetical protein
LDDAWVLKKRRALKPALLVRVPLHGLSDPRNGLWQIGEEAVLWQENLQKVSITFTGGPAEANC